MRVLIGCEESATVRDAFRKLGHDAYSCDLMGSRGDSAWHITGDVFRAIRKRGPWDMLIVFPPCTHLCVSGARWWPKKLVAQYDAIEFCRHLIDEGCVIGKFAMENPIGILSTAIRKPDQIIQPWMFGHMEQKSTCLWLYGLPKLVPTNDVKAEMLKLPKNQRERLHYLPPSPTRARDRSKTFQGIADAMAMQWGGDIRATVT